MVYKIDLLCRTGENDFQMLNIEGFTSTVEEIAMWKRNNKE